MYWKKKPGFAFTLFLLIFTLTIQLAPIASAEDSESFFDLIFPKIMEGQKEPECISEDPDDVNLFVYSNQVGNACHSPQGFNEEAAKNYATLVSNCATLLELSGVRLFSAPGPTSVGLLSEKYRVLLHSADQGEILEYIASQTKDNVFNVNIYPILKKHKDEYLYFRTDHHWTALAAYYAYVAFCEKAGLVPADLSEFDVLDEGEFLGTYYQTAPRTDLLETDDLIAYVPRGHYKMLVTEKNGKVKEFDSPIVDYSEKDKYEKYNSFILGDNIFVDIENLDMPDEVPSCVVLKDSFGDPFSVYLTQNYKHVYVMDYRHFKTPVARWVKEHPEVQDVIICQSIGVSQTFKAMSVLEMRLSE